MATFASDVMFGLHFGRNWSTCSSDLSFVVWGSGCGVWGVEFGV
jgi:hypothetical protein